MEVTALVSSTAEGSVHVTGTLVTPDPTLSEMSDGQLLTTGAVLSVTVPGRYMDWEALITIYFV